jgi:hypothetical protein
MNWALRNAAVATVLASDAVPHVRFAENRVVYFPFAAKGADAAGTECRISTC